MKDVRAGGKQVKPRAGVYLIVVRRQRTALAERKLVEGFSRIPAVGGQSFCGELRRAATTPPELKTAGRLARR
jgi:hypothetical protein